MSDQFFYLQFKFIPKIGHPFTDEREVVVEIPKDLVQRKARYARNRPSVGSEYVGVERRLIELWHESLAKSAKARSWEAFSNLNAGRSKKAAYTAQANH